MKIQIKRVRNVKLPTRGTPGSAGLDFYVPEDSPILTITPGRSLLIKSGIKAKFDKDHALIAFNKSSRAVRDHLLVGAEVIDEDYQGELGLHVVNVDRTENVVLKPGDKIVQFLLIPVKYPEVEEVDEIHEIETLRGEGGYGSTGNE